MRRPIENAFWMVAVGLLTGVSAAVVGVGRRMGWEVERESPGVE